MASSWGWWTLSASASVNVIACSSVVLVLRDHPKSWTFCTNFRYVFLDLDDWPAELPPIITLISPSGGLRWLFYLPFQLLILMLLSKEISQFSLSCKIFNLLFQIVTFVHVVPIVSMEAKILVPIALVRISLHFLWPFQGRIIVDLHKDLLEWHVQWRVLLTPCWRTSPLTISVFLIFCPSLF